MTDIEQRPKNAEAPWPQGIAVGIAAGVVGLLPWLVTGATLPLQNLWGSDTAPADMPFALLPISQYSLLTILGLLVFGAVLAGLLARSRPRWTWPAYIGVALVHVVAAIQSLIVLKQGLRASGEDSRAGIYFGGMTLVVVLAVVLALVGYLLVSRRSLAIVAVGIGLVAVPLTGWIGEWAQAVFGAGGIPLWALEVIRWAPAVFVGIALGFCGVNPVSRIGVWVLDLFLLWIAPAATTAITSAAGTRAFGGNLAEMADYAAAVLRSALFDVAPWPVLGAIVIGTVVALGRAAVSRGGSEPVTEAEGVEHRAYS